MELFEGYVYYGAVAVLMGLLGLLSVLQEFSFRRALATVTFLVLLGTTFQATVDLLSRPRPVELMLVKPNPAKAKVLAVHAKEDEYMMLLLHWDGLDYPRYFRFPWDKQMAEQMQSAAEDAEEKNAEGVEMHYPFDKSLDRREFPWAHPMPTPKQMRPKTNEPPKVFEYKHPGQSA